MATSSTRKESSIATTLRSTIVQRETRSTRAKKATRSPIAIKTITSAAKATDHLVQQYKEQQH